MANESATVKLSGWQEYTCSACRTVYRCRFDKEETRSAATAEEATTKARQALQSSVTHDSEVRPCPQCGLVQPDMVGWFRMIFHALVFLLSVVGFWMVFVLAGNDHFTKHVVLWYATILALVCCAGYFLVSNRSFNADMAANRERAAQRIAKGEIAITSPGDSAGHSIDGSFRQAGTRVIFGLLIATALFVPAAEVMRIARGWPLNPAWYPGVAGPGDRPYAYFPEELKCIKSMWNGQAEAEVVNAAEVGLPKKTKLKTETKKDQWAGTITALKHESFATAYPWVMIDVPEVADPAGKKLEVKMKLDLTYPEPKEVTGFQDKNATFTHSEPLVLATPGAGAQYMLLWWLATLASAVVTVTAGIVLMVRDYQLIKTAHPVQVLSLSGQKIDFDKDVE